MGAGIVGASTAFNLARLGVRRVLVLERQSVAAQASRLSAGLVRTHYGNAPEARLAWRGLQWFESWGEMVGGEVPFWRTGMINPVARSDQEVLRRNVAMLQSVGVDTQLIGPEEMVELEPAIHAEEDDLAAYEPRSGYAEPGGATRAMAEAARRLGAEIAEGEEVTAVLVDGDRVAGVDTSLGRVPAPVVVLANGAWSVPLARAVGVEIPIESLGVRLAFVQRPPELRRGWGRHAVVLDRAHGAYMRPEGEDRSMVGLMGERVPLSAPDRYEAEAPSDEAFETTARAQVARRFPSFAEAPVLARRTGPIDVTPDLCAIIDRVEPEGLFLAVGMSGSGFKKGPAIGESVAELVVHGESRTTPVREFRLSRFAENDPIRSEGYSGPYSLVH